MSDKPQSIGKKILGLFVVQEDEETQRSEAAPPTGDAVADDLIARYVGGAPQRRPEPPAPEAEPVGPLPPSGVPAAAAQLDFADLLRKRGVGAEEQGHVERALTLLGNLPRETPREIKRQIVEAALIAFGVPVDRIIESALVSQGALDQHVREVQRETHAFLEETNRRLQELELEAARLKKLAQDQLARQESIGAACAAQHQKVQEILDFFGADAVERVRAASARLRGS